MMRHRIAMLVSRGAESIGEYVFHVKAPSEQVAVDLLAGKLCPEFTARFLGMRGEIVPAARTAR